MYINYKYTNFAKKQRGIENMSFDGIVTRAVVCELKNKITGAKIDKIYQPEQDEIILNIRSSSDTFRLLMSASSSNPRLHLTFQKRENPVSAPLFCMILRKQLQGGRILSVNQIASDRVIEFKIESYTELGDLTVKRLIIEIMGRHSNIILVSENGLIIDSIKHIDLTVSSVRQILPKLMYEFPPMQSKLQPSDVSEFSLGEIFKDSDKKAVCENILVSSVTGLSPLLAREICFRAVGKTGVPLCDTAVDCVAAAAVNMFKLSENEKFTPSLVYDEGKRHPRAFSCFELTQYRPLPQIFSDSISEIIDIFYEERSQNERISQKSAAVSKTISNNIDRCRKKIQLHKLNLKNSQNRDKYKIYGDLLTANIYKLVQGDTKALVENYYSENAEEIEIPLKPELSPSANAQRYYKLYSKAKSAEKHSAEELKKAEDELYYLETVAEALSLAKSAADIDEIKTELFEQGYVKASSGNSKSKKPKNKNKKGFNVSPLEFVTSDGFTVLVGRNNKENDFLTLKSSFSTDIWLHTKNIPGSHTIIKTKGNPTASDTAIYEAAALAAYHSKAQKSSQVPVDYTNIKNVKKPNGAKPGFVIYDSYSTVYVQPDESLTESLKENAKSTSSDK